MTDRTCAPVAARRVARQAGDEPAVLFVVGAPRSGTSLLYKALCLHPDAAYVSNWLQRAPGLPMLAVLNRLGGTLPELRRQAWFGGEDGNAYVYGRPRPARERLFPMPTEGEVVFRWCGIDDGPDLRQVASLHRTFRAVGRWAGCPVVVSKRIAHNRRIPLLAAMFPSARFVNLVRDGRAVAASLSRVDWWERSTVWWYGRTPGHWRAEGRDPWELCATHWVRELACVDQGLAAVPPDRRMDLHYEALVEQPIGVLRQVAAFAGLRDSQTWTGELARLRYPNRNDAWRKLPAAVRDRIQAVQRDALRMYGYVD